MQKLSSISNQQTTKAPAFIPGQKKYSTPFFQPKLNINDPNDQNEKQADAVADEVMRMETPAIQTKADNHLFFSASPVTISSVQRKCAHCEEEEKRMQRKEMSEDETGADASLENYLGNLSGSGQSMPEGVRNFYEPHFGHDFSDVKIHTNNIAARSAQSINAIAYTSGKNIVFNEGQYSPETSNGKKLLAHELTHVVQQGGAQQRIMRFGSAEHVTIGTNAVGGNTLVTAFGNISFGEMNALGDYFENVDEIARLAESWGQFGKDQIQYALWLVNPGVRSNPSVGQSVIDAVMDRYYRLASRNEAHFSTGSSPGNTNRDRYITMHTQAIQDAYAEGSNPLIVRRWNWQAREAFAEHYLQDAFSAGHVRTPRGDIQRHWSGLYPNFTNSLVNMISCFMASHINERDNVGYVQTVNALTARIAPIIQQQAGTVLSAFSIGDLISKVVHDADNAGLDVVSPRGVTGSSPLHWRAVGDEHLYAPAGTTASTAQRQTQQMVEQASRLSNQEASQAYSAGLAHDATRLAMLSNSANFAALQLIPVEDTASVSNPTYLWRASGIRTLPANIRALILAAFTPGAEVRSKLDGLTVACLTQAMGFDLHTRDAFLCFKDQFLANVWGMIVRIAEGTTLCPPGQNDPCPTRRNACP